MQNTVLLEAFANTKHSLIRGFCKYSTKQSYSNIHLKQGSANFFALRAGISLELF